MSNPKFEYMLEHKGWKVILTDHARQQAVKRHGMPIEQMRRFFVGAIDGIIEADFQVQEYNQEVFIYSRSFCRGMIVAFRRDYKNPNNKNLALAVVTVYPYGAQSPAHKDTQTVRV